MEKGKEINIIRDVFNLNCVKFKHTMSNKTVGGVKKLRIGTFEDLSDSKIEAIKNDLSMFCSFVSVRKSTRGIYNEHSILIDIKI